MAPAQTLTAAQAGYITQLALVSLGGVLLACLLVAALHVLSPEFDPITRAMSDYVHSRCGLLMTAAFAGLASGLIALAAAVWPPTSSSYPSAGAVLLAAAGAATLVAGLFPIDNTPDGRYTTTRGAVHAVSGFMLSPLLVIGMLCLSGPWNWTGDNSLLQSTTQGLAGLNASTFAALVIVNAIRWSIGGLGQRVFMGVTCLWLLLTSIRLLMLASAA